MKTILLPVEQHDLIESTLETACRLAHVIDGYVEGFWLSPPPIPYIGAEGFGATMIHDTDFDRENETQRDCQLIFEKAMRSHGLSPAGVERKGPTYGWTERRGSGDIFLGTYGRLFDVTVLGRPGSEASAPRFGTFEAALFDTGRPVLLAPPSSLGSLGENVLISWNSSVETVRTIAFAMPLLRRAARITILSITGHGPSEPSGEALARQFEHHGISATAVTLDASGQAVGEVILREAAELGCDLVLKGAYTQTRLRQFIFGGTTRHLVTEARVPVLMAH